MNIAVSFSCAEEILLKNGNKIEGKIIESTDEYVKVDFNGVPLTYWRDDIESVGSKKMPEKSSDTVQATVIVRAKLSNGPNQGSGFIVEPKGMIVTNFHTIAGATYIEVILGDGTRYPVTGIAGYSVENDICILKIDADNLTTLNLNDYSRLTPGQKVTFIGAPHGFDYTVIDGLYRGKHYDNDGTPFLQFSADISPGDSGGPLLDGQGSVLGILILPKLPKQKLNSALPATAVKKIMGRSSFLTWEQFTEKVNPAYVLYQQACDAAEKDKEKAAEYLKQAVDLDPNLSAAYKLLAETYYAMGMPDEAVLQWKKVLELDPQYSYADTQIAARYCDQGKNEEAMSYAQKKLDSNSQDPLLLSSLGEIYERSGDLDKAGRLLEQAINKDPDWPIGHCKLGDIYQRKGDPADAAREYKTAVELDPYYLQPYINLIWLLREQNQPDLAVKYYQQAKHLGFQLGLFTEERMKPYLLAKSDAFGSYANRGECNKAYNSLDAKSRLLMDLCIGAVRNQDVPLAAKYALQAIAGADMRNPAAYQFISQVVVIIDIDCAENYYKKGLRDEAIAYYLKAIPVAENLKSNEWFKEELLHTYYALSLAYLAKKDITNEDVAIVDGYIDKLITYKDTFARQKVVELEKKARQAEEEIFLRM